MPDVPDFILREQPGVDLRRVGSHPDHWYPLAWSRELKPGQRYATTSPVSRWCWCGRRKARCSRWRTAAPIARCRCRSGVVSGCALRCGYHGWTYDASGKCVDVPYLGKGKLPNGVRAYPCREQDGLILIWPGDPAAVTELGPLGAGVRPGVQDPALRQDGALPLQLHAREPDGHEPSVPAPQADGPDRAALPGPPRRRGLAGDRLQLRPHRRQAADRRGGDHGHPPRRLHRQPAT